MKPGDKIICVNVDFNKRLVVGNIYIVQAITDYHVAVDAGLFLKYRFKLHKQMSVWNKPAVKE